jgi:flavin-dependent dehydrogenase
LTIDHGTLIIPAVTDARTFEVIILGGGPGGTTLGALLAREGVSVCLFERETFPRFRIGESLLPYSIPVWRRSGVLPKLHEAGFMIKPGARFVVDETLEEECFWFRNGLEQHEDLAYAFQVQRAPFDKLLLDHARECGVTVMQPVTATGWRSEQDAAVLETSAGEIRASLLCDASGRWTFLSSRQNQRRIHTQHRKIACFAHYHNARRCEQDPGNIIIVRFGETRMGWFWLIPFTDGTASVGVVADAAYYRETDVTPAQFLDKSLRDSRHLWPRMKDATLASEVMTEADFSYTSDHLAGERWLKIGDAGAFIDPIFSSGVLLSTRAAEFACDAILAARAGGDWSEAAFAEYERTVKEGTRAFWGFIDAFYNRDFLKQMVTSQRRPLLQRSITSLLAGGVFKSSNPMIPYLLGEQRDVSDRELQQLL